jgi:hypothetical protein
MFLIDPTAAQPERNTPGRAADPNLPLSPEPGRRRGAIDREMRAEFEAEMRSHYDNGY